MLLVGIGAFVVMALDVLAINHLGGTSTILLGGLAGVAVVALFMMSGATPAALGLLADVSEGFEEDRSAIMGLYSVFLGLGQVIGAVLGGIFASWRGIDGLLVATAILLAIGLVTLANLRRNDVGGLEAALHNEAAAAPMDAFRDTSTGAAGSGDGRSRRCRQGGTMTVAIVTDSGSDLTPAQLSESRIHQVPLTVSFGDRSYLSPDELAPEDFWKEMSSPGSPFAHTAAPSAGQFKRVFEQAFDDGADGIVCVCLSETLSATVQSARMAREMLPGRHIEVVDSRSASMAIGALALRGAAMAAEGATATEIAEALTRLRNQTLFYVALETLEYLRRGGRISDPRRLSAGCCRSSRS